MITTLVGFALMVAAAGQGDGKTIAVINGEEVKSGDYYHRMEYMSGVYSPFNDRLLEVPPGLATLDRIITERLTLQLATEHGVMPKPAEIETAYASRLASNPTMEKDAAERGISVVDIKLQVTLDLARYKLITQDVIVTDAEVQETYDGNHRRYSTPKLVDIRYIVVDSDAGKSAVDTALGAGKDFGDVARDLSVDVSKINKGFQGSVPFDSFDQSIQDALSAIKIGQTTDWIPVPKQAAGSTLVEKIQYLKATQPVLLPLDAALRESIRRKLMIDRGSLKNDLAKELKEMVAKSKIDIKDPVFAKAWADLRTSALKNESGAPKTGG